jgi:hypothetical protein
MAAVAVDGIKPLPRIFTDFTDLKPGPHNNGGPFFLCWNSFRVGEQEMLGVSRQRLWRDAAIATASPVAEKKSFLTFSPWTSHGLS